MGRHEHECNSPSEVRQIFKKSYVSDETVALSEALAGQERIVICAGVANAQNGNSTVAGELPIKKIVEKVENGLNG